MLGGNNWQAAALYMEKHKKQPSPLLSPCHTPVGYKFGLFQQRPEVSFGSDVFVPDVLLKLPLLLLQGKRKVSNTECRVSA